MTYRLITDQKPMRKISLPSENHQVLFDNNGGQKYGTSKKPIIFPL